MSVSNTTKRVKEIRRKTRRKFSSEEKIRIVLEGLRGECSIAELCRREGINANLYYRWSKDFLEAGKRLMEEVRLATLAVSLGGVETLISHPASMTHASVPEERREEHGLGDRQGLFVAAVAGGKPLPPLPRPRSEPGRAGE